MDSSTLFTSVGPSGQYLGSMPPANPVDDAVARFNKQQVEIATPLRQYQTFPAYQNLDIILARLNRIEQMIDGATISATCSGTATVITLTWGA